MGAMQARSMQSPRMFSPPPSEYALVAPGLPLNANDIICKLNILEPDILTNNILMKLPLADIHAFTACSKSCHKFVEREMHTRVRIISQKKSPVRYVVQSTRVMKEGSHCYLHIAWYEKPEQCFIHRMSTFFEREFGSKIARSKIDGEIRWKDACVIMYKFSDSFETEHSFVAKWNVIKIRLKEIMRRRALPFLETGRCCSSLFRLSKRAVRVMDAPYIIYDENGFSERVKRVIVTGECNT